MKFTGQLPKSEKQSQAKVQTTVDLHMPNLDKQMRKTKKCNFSGAYLFILVFPCRTMVLLPSLTIFLFLDNKWDKLRLIFQKLLFNKTESNTEDE